MFTQVRDQFLNIWKSQGTVQRVVLIGLVVSALVLVVVFFTWANTPTYTAAFSGLEEADAGQIVEKLKEQGIEYQLKDGGTILVSSDQVYEVRLGMAREGLPAGGNVGWELFSGTTLGMTEFTQRVNYQRAIEGELERTIGSMDAIEAVRVHIVQPEKALLSSDQVPTTASITIREKPGQHLDTAQVKAVTHLVASSVESLKPENVVVVDVNGNMLASGGMDGEESTAVKNDNHRAAELAASSDLKKKVQDLLDTSLGPNRSVVQASVTMDWTEREVKSQSYDPASSTVRSSQVVTEVYTTTAGTTSGVPGASTNLPSMLTTTDGSDSQGTTYHRTEGTTNYEITQTETHEVRAPGEVERISLSVLVDGITDTVQLDKLQTVIAAAAGIDETRGDLLAVQTLDFDRTYFEEQAAEIETSQQTEMYWRIGEIAAGVLLLAALLWYVSRLLTNLRLASSQAWTPIMKPVMEVALPGPMASMSNNIPQSMDFGGMQIPQIPMAPQTPQPKQPDPVPVVLPQVEMPQISAEEEQMQRVLSHLAEENPAAVAEIIQMWLNEDTR